MNLVPGPQGPPFHGCRPAVPGVLFSDHSARGTRRKSVLLFTFVILGVGMSRFKPPLHLELSASMSESFPPTVIVRHPNENPRKCSVLPLRGRPDLVFLPYPVKGRPPLGGYIRLAAEGPPLSAADAGAGLLLLDGSWR